MAKRNHTQGHTAAANDICFTPAESAERGFTPRTFVEALQSHSEEPTPRPPRKAPEMKAERHLTVSLYPQALPQTPWIRLRGRWLEQAGFPLRTRVRVQVAQGCLILTPAAAQAT